MPKAADCPHANKTGRFFRKVGGTWYWMRECKGCRTPFQEEPLSPAQIKANNLD